MHMIAKAADAKQLRPTDSLRAVLFLVRISNPIHIRFRSRWNRYRDKLVLALDRAQRALQGPYLRDQEQKAAYQRDDPHQQAIGEQRRTDRRLGQDIFGWPSSMRGSRPRSAQIRSSPIKASNLHHAGSPTVWRSDG